MMSRARQWYAVGAYVPLDNKLDMHCVKPALVASPKGVELILLGKINLRMGDPCIEREEYLAMELADQGLVDMIAHFLP